MTHAAKFGQITECVLCGGTGQVDLQLHLEGRHHQHLGHLVVAKNKVNVSGHLQIEVVFRDTQVGVINKRWGILHSFLLTPYLADNQKLFGFDTNSGMENLLGTSKKFQIFWNHLI